MWNPEILANSGGPMSRRRTEHVLASLLRNDDSPLQMPRVIRAALHFGDQDPLEAVTAAMHRRGVFDPDQLRHELHFPDGPLLVRVVPGARWGVYVARAHDTRILIEALLLGLCTAYQYDPARPVLWTRASLTRRVELYEPSGFYA
jgi:hypothetical protein